MQSTRQSSYPLSTWWIDILFLLLFLGSLFFFLLGVKPLFVPDEGRYAEIAREMATTGNYITPYLNGIKYFEKPILFYWLETAAIKAAGIHLWSLRSINALLGLLGCFMTYFCTRKLYDRTTGLLAALILGTSALYFTMVHMISLDLPVTVFLAICFYCFLLGTQTPPGTTRRLYLWNAAIFAGLAVLSKGLIGIVFPILIIGTWIVFTKQWRLLKKLYIPSSLCLFLLLTALWHILVSLSNPEFFHFYFIEQHFLRYTTKEIGHYQPVWFFLPYLIIGFFPWILFLPQAITQLLRPSPEQSRKQLDLFFLLWALLIFIFFSFSKSKLIPYILPVIPPLAILVARYIKQALDVKPLWGIKMAYTILVIFAIIAAIALYWFSHYTHLPNPQLVVNYLSLASFFLVTGSLLSCFYAFSTLRKASTITFIMTWLFLLSMLAAIPSIDTRTIKPLAMVLKPLLHPGDEVITYNQYYQDLPFYLERRVSILNWKNELSYGMQYQNTNDWMIDDATFWQRFNSNKRVFVLMSKDEYQQFQKTYPSKKIYLLGTTLTNVLISNQLVSPSSALK